MPNQEFIGLRLVWPDDDWDGHNNHTSGSNEKNENNHNTTTNDGTEPGVCVQGQ